MNPINLNKLSYLKNQYEQVIDTKFNQLLPSVEDSTSLPTISIDTFFQYYNNLFY